MKKTAAKKDKMRPTQKAMKLTDMSSGTDFLGSYTGNAANKYERPVQDADDL